MKFRILGFHPDGRDCWVSTKKEINMLKVITKEKFPSRRAGLLGFYQNTRIDFARVSIVSIPTGGIVGFLLNVAL